MNQASQLATEEKKEQTVLLVEDADALRKLAARILEANGYSVLHARDAEDALDVSKKHPGKIDLLLTDVVLPQGSGPELAKQLACIRPEAKVLYMSGHTEDKMLSRVVQSVFIQKPFTPRELEKKVREVLAA